MSGHQSVCWGDVTGIIGWKLEMLQTFCTHMWQSTNKYLTQDINNAEVEKPPFRILSFGIVILGTSVHSMRHRKLLDIKDYILIIFAFSYPSQWCRCTLCKMLNKCWMKWTVEGRSNALQECSVVIILHKELWKITVWLHPRLDKLKDKLKEVTQLQGNDTPLHFFLLRGNFFFLFNDA